MVLITLQPHPGRLPYSPRPCPIDLGRSLYPEYLAAVTAFRLGGRGGGIEVDALPGVFVGEATF